MGFRSTLEAHFFDVILYEYQYYLCFNLIHAFGESMSFMHLHGKNVICLFVRFLSYN